MWLHREEDLVQVRELNSVHSLNHSVWSLPEQDEADGLNSCPSDIIVHVTHLTVKKISKAVITRAGV